MKLKQVGWMPFDGKSGWTGWCWPTKARVRKEFSDSGELKGRHIRIVPVFIKVKCRADERKEAGHGA